MPEARIEARQNYNGYGCVLVPRLGVLKVGIVSILLNKTPKKVFDMTCNHTL